MANELILVADFGGQYNQLIARRVREDHVYCEVVPFTQIVQVAKQKRPKGIIFTGGPASVYEEGAPSVSKEIFELGIPVLGICYGAQLTAHLLGGKVKSPDFKEYGKVQIKLDVTSPLFTGLQAQNTCWMSHRDYIEQLPAGFRVTAVTDLCPVAAMEDASRRLYAVQFHPEVYTRLSALPCCTAFYIRFAACRGIGAWATLPKKKLPV